MSFYGYCADWFVEHLERDIAAHEAGRYAEIGQSERDMPEYSLCEDEIGEERLSIAWNFWDQWIDARNHDWSHYPGVEERDWPVIARQIVRGLRENWTPESMMENAVFNPPPLEPNVSLWRRFNRYFGGD